MYNQLKEVIYTSTVNERFRIVRESLGVSQEAFAVKGNRTRSEIKNIEYGKTEPKSEVINAICSAWNINEIWLRTGVGEPFQKKERAQEMTELFSELMNDRPESFRTRLITALLRFKPDSPEWAVLEKIYNSIQDEANAETAEETDS